MGEPCRSFLAQGGGETRRTWDRWADPRMGARASQARRRIRHASLGGAAARGHGRGRTGTESSTRPTDSALTTRCLVTHTTIVSDASCCVTSSGAATCVLLNSTRCLIGWSGPSAAAAKNTGRSSSSGWSRLKSRCSSPSSAPLCFSTMMPSHAGQSRLARNGSGTVCMGPSPSKIVMSSDCSAHSENLDESWHENWHHTACRTAFIVSRAVSGPLLVAQRRGKNGSTHLDDVPRPRLQRVGLLRAPCARPQHARECPACARRWRNGAGALCESHRRRARSPRCPWPRSRRHGRAARGWAAPRRRATRRPRRAG